jgi:hypothetical protein
VRSPAQIVSRLFLAGVLGWATAGLLAWSNPCAGQPPQPRVRVIGIRAGPRPEPTLAGNLPLTEIEPRTVVLGSSVERIAAEPDTPPAPPRPPRPSEPATGITLLAPVPVDPVPVLHQAPPSTKQEPGLDQAPPAPQSPIPVAASPEGVPGTVRNRLLGLAVGLPLGAVGLVLLRRGKTWLGRMRVRPPRQPQTLHVHEPGPRRRRTPKPSPGRDPALLRQILEQNLRLRKELGASQASEAHGRPSVSLAPSAP